MTELDDVNAAVARIRERNPLGEGKLTDAFLVKVDADVELELEAIGAGHDHERAWVDVLLEGQRWMGRWADDCPEEAAIWCAFWTGDKVLSYGYGIKGTTDKQDARQARIDSGDLLALLGDEW